MRVKIPNRNTMGGVLDHVQGSNSNVVEVTKAHRLISCRVMSRRPHETECTLAAQRCMRSFDRRTGGTQGMFINVWISRRVRVEIMRCVFYPCQMIARMRPQ